MERVKFKEVERCQGEYAMLVVKKKMYMEEKCVLKGTSYAVVVI